MKNIQTECSLRSCNFYTWQDLMDWTYQLPNCPMMVLLQLYVYAVLSSVYSVYSEHADRDSRNCC